jgi:hypothetical protein
MAEFCLELAGDIKVPIILFGRIYQRQRMLKIHEFSTCSVNFDAMSDTKLLCYRFKCGSFLYSCLQKLVHSVYIIFNISVHMTKQDSSSIPDETSIKIYKIV